MARNHEALSGDVLSRGAFLSAVGATALAGAAVVSSPRAAHAETAPSGTAPAGMLNVRDHGAVGDGVTDDSGAFQRALDEIVAASEGALYVPPGNYVFAHRVEVSTTKLHLAIVGAGQGISNLFSTNTDGIFAVDTAPACQITVTDLSFFADRQGAGTALEVTRPRGDRHHRSLTVRDVEMRGVAFKEDYFDYGLRAVNQVNPLVTNVIVAGPFAGGVNKDRTDDSLLYAATCGISLSGCYAPVVENCYVWSAFTGFSLVSEGTAPVPEGGWFYNCFAVGVRVGFDVRTPDSLEPGFALERCHANGRDVGVRVNRTQFTITNCLLYNSLPGDDFTPDTAPEYTDILVESGWVGVISDNIFRQPFNNNRTGVRIAGVENDVTGKSSHLLIKDNYFTAPGTAISVAPGVEDVVVAGNQFLLGTDPYTDRQLVTTILDDGSGTAALSSDELRAASARMTQEQPVPDGQWTTVGWQEAEYDTYDFWDADDPEALVVPPGRGIRYVRIAASVAWEASSHGRRELQVLRNGETVSSGVATEDKGPARGPASGDADVQSVRTAVVPVDGGDRISLRVRQTTGAALALLPEGGASFSVEAVNG